MKERKKSFHPPSTGELMRNYWIRRTELGSEKKNSEKKGKKIVRSHLHLNDLLMKRTELLLERELKEENKSFHSQSCGEYSAGIMILT